VRWRILALLAGFSLMSYICRVSLTVAGEPIMRQFHLSAVQLGWIFTAFLFTYTAFNTPSGAWTDRFGARRVMAAAGLSWAALGLLTAYLPGSALLPASWVLGTFILLRLALGICEAPTYAGATKAVADWLPDSERGLANALVISGAFLGSAVTGPLISVLMVHIGWRNAVAVSSLAAPLLVSMWWLYARDHPREHRGVNKAELEVISGPDRKAAGRTSPTGGWRILLSSGQAWRLCAIYACQTYLGYLFIWWCYVYFIEVRHFSLVKGGFAAAGPFVVAMFSTPIAGALSDGLTARLGPRRGRRLVPMIALGAAAVVAFAGVRVESGQWAVVLLSIGAALGWMCEGPTWAAIVEIAAPIAGTAGGLLNTGGNVGGAAAALATPWIAREFGWSMAFGTASVIALAGSALWIGFDPQQALSTMRAEP
jgi:ACS family glucarate transporter-like MFS transporter